MKLPFVLSPKLIQTANKIANFGLAILKTAKIPAVLLIATVSVNASPIAIDCDATVTKPVNRICEANHVRPQTYAGPQVEVRDVL